MKQSYIYFSNLTVGVLELQETDDFVSDEAILVYRYFLFGTICQMINVFGLVTNVINVICFIKQGFRDTVNISLLGLAISDIGCLITLTWTNICLIPAFIEADLPIDLVEFQYLKSGMPHTTFTRITSWVTAFITLERCLCITMPLKVKGILTKRRIYIAVICIYIILFASASPVYVVCRLGWKFVSHRNKSILGIINEDNREQVESVSYAINNVALPSIAFIMIIVCTTTLVINLEKGAQLRKKTMVNEQAGRLYVRNQKIAKMVLMISTLFICCFVPISVTFLVMSFEPEFSLTGKYKNTLLVVGGFGVNLEAVNSSVNIFIYFSMSSKYRAVLHQMFRARAQRNSPINNIRQMK